MRTAAHDLGIPSQVPTSNPEKPSGWHGDRFGTGSERAENISYGSRSNALTSRFIAKQIAARMQGDYTGNGDTLATH
jgi:hypothetical protein